MATPRNRSELQDVAHPGHKTVYRKGEDENGKRVVFVHVLPEIDAHDAVIRFPDEYSYDEPENAGPITPADGVDPYAIPPAVPVHTSPAAAMGPVTGDTVQRPAVVSDVDPTVVTAKDGEKPPIAVDGIAQKVTFDNEAAVDQAKSKNGK